MSPAAGADVFARATTRLVVLFTAIVVALVVVSGVVMYLTVKTNISDVAQGSSGGGEAEVERAIASRSINRVRWQLVALDGVIIVAVGGLGFWYARRTLRPIRELYGAQKRFVADASHELRTPLAIMKADFEVALRDEPGGGAPAGRPDELREAVSSGLEEVDRMSAIVDDLLLLSRIDAHQEELRFAPVELAELVRRTAEGMRAMGERARVAVAVTAPSGAVTATADAAHLERALRNIVRNGIEHSSPGGNVRREPDGRRRRGGRRRGRRGLGHRARRSRPRLRPLLPGRLVALARRRRQRPRPGHRALDRRAPRGSPSPRKACRGRARRSRCACRWRGRGTEAPRCRAAPRATSCRADAVLRRRR